MNIDKKLKSIIITIATHVAQDVDENLINENTILTSELGYDSVQIIELIVALEDEFNIEIDDDDLDIENLTNYGNLYEMICKKTEGSN